MGSSHSQPARPSRRRQQSSPARTQAGPSSSTRTPSLPPSTTATRPAPAQSRFASLRRLSALGRRDSQKRDRATSPGAEAEINGAQNKKRRVGSSTSPASTMSILPDARVPLQSSSTPMTAHSDVNRAPRAGPSAPLQHGSLPTSPGPPILPTLPVPSQDPHGLTSSPLPSPPIDPLLPDRLETLDTIRNTLGSDWTANTQDPITTEERLQRIATTLDRIERTRAGHRDSLLGLAPLGDSVDTRPATAPTATAATTTGDTPSTRFTERFCSLLGIGSSATSHDDHEATSGDLQTDPDSLADASADDLQERIERARADLADVQRQLEAARAVNESLSGLSRPGSRGPEAAPGTGGADSEVEAGAGQAVGPQRRIPAGAVLVIQGLAQAHAPDRSATTRTDNRRTRSWMRSETSPSRPAQGRARSSSDSHVPVGGSAGVGEESDTDGLNESLDGQARMISNLLTVAAAATAQTLLVVPETSPPEPRSPPSALSNVIDRLRPQRRRAPQPETALGEYLRTVLRDRTRAGDAPALSGDGSSVTRGEGIGVDAVPSPEFQQFLEGLQVDLLGAVRQFATPSNESNEPSEAAERNGTASTALVSTAATGESANAGHAQGEAAARGETAENTLADDTAAHASGEATNPPTPDTAAVTSAVPAYHYQLGQTRPDDAARRNGVSGGTNGQPRRLNFFRAHQFPPVRMDQPGVTTGADDLNGMVPCIFIGVRSLNHDPSLTTDELVQHPNFPFLDGQAPEASAAAEGVSEDPTTQATTAAAASSASASTVSLPSTAHTSEDGALPVTATTSAPQRRSGLGRALDFLTPRRQAPPPAPRPLNTYLVFVIGGHYPRSHPILSIPSLLTGDPLTDEEMVLVGELMGPGKPPTASKEDIESAGLRLVDAGEIARLGEDGVVLSNCVDRCLVCLGDYEPGEECRVLKCRHAYHRACVDEWLSKGRNSCPACRTEAVETKQRDAAVDDAPATAAL